jgi:hypothetical protein
VPKKGGKGHWSKPANAGAVGFLCLSPLGWEFTAEAQARNAGNERPQ